MRMEPSALPPMLALLSAQLPDNAAGTWAFEWKWDGYRAIVHRSPRALELWSRNQKPLGGRFPQLQSLKRALPPHTILDGEVVALDARGRPSFSALQQRSHTPTVIVLMLFDLLYLRGRSLLRAPYRERRERLLALSLADEHWQTPLAQVGITGGQTMWAAARALRFEGVVAKRLESPYLPGARSGDWLKVKLTRRDEFVVAGYVPLEHDPRAIGKLLLGSYDTDGNLHSAGGVGTGFTTAERIALKQRLDRHRLARSPFASGRFERSVVFARPLLVAEVSYSERTPGGSLRHPSFQGLRSDKRAREVTEPGPAPALR